MEFRKKDLLTIPNILTYIRIICVPFFIWMMIEYQLSNFVEVKYLYIGFSIFVFASFTDVLDGYIARKYNMVSDIGKILDPFADKLLQVSAIVMLAINGMIFWGFAIFLAIKELYMIIESLVFMKISKNKVEQKANKLGKMGALLMFIGLILGFFSKLLIVIEILSNIIILISSIMMIIAAITYTKDHIKQYKTFKLNKEI